MAKGLSEAYDHAASFGTAPANRNMQSLRAWIVNAGGPTLNDLGSQYDWIFAYTGPPPADGGGGGDAGGGGGGGGE